MSASADEAGVVVADFASTTGAGFYFFKILSALDLHSSGELKLGERTLHLLRVGRDAGFISPILSRRSQYLFVKLRIFPPVSFLEGSVDRTHPLQHGLPVRP